jgi:SNF2 family DNA or RNA helicase
MNSVLSLRNHLEMFQQAFSNALTEDSPMAEQPSHMKTNLKIHQLAAIYSMREKEIALRKGFKVPGSEETLFSQYAFLGDRVGVGKTFMVLGHISQMALTPLTQGSPLSNLHPNSTAACFSILPEPVSNNLYDSLIVVPHTIYRQWQDTAKKHTTLKVLYLKTLRDLEKDTLISNLEASHLTLISNTLLASFMNSLQARNITPKWRRVIYDEADTITIKNTTPSPSAIMTWYVTASYTNLLLSNQYYHSYIIRQLPPSFLDSLHPILKESLQLQITTHPNVTIFKTQSHSFFKERIQSHHPLRGHLVIMNSDAFLDNSVSLPALHTDIIRCETPITQQLVESAISPEIQDMLHAGDIQGALQGLGISSHTSVSIVDAVTAYKQKELERLVRLLAFKAQEEYASEQAKEAALAALQVKIDTVKQQIEAIKIRIEEASKDGCSICFDSAEGPVLTPCCSKVFCANCILSWMQRKPACPLCRESFHPSQLCSIGPSQVQGQGQGQKTRLPKKIDALLSLINANPNGKFLIFSRYENPLQALHENLETTHKVGTLQGNKDVIAHMLEDFAKGKIKILLLNSRNAAAGINIPMATHVILLHKMIHEEEKQILGRAYRMGRTEPLHFIKLLHERE